METPLTAGRQSEYDAVIEAAPPTPDVAIPEVPVQAVANQLGDVAADTVTLLDLQIRLFEAECRQSALQLVKPVIIFAGTWMMAVASVAVLLLALGTGLHELTGWPLSVTLLISAIIGFCITAAAVKYAVELLKTPRISFAKSKEELIRNAEVLSRMLKTR